MGLLGKADATLAGMSYRSAMANVAPDLKDIYQGEVELQKQFQTDIKEYFDVVNADNNALADELKEATTIAMTNLSAGITPDEAGMELFNDHLNGLKERLKTIPAGKEGDLERAKVRGELSRLKNSTDGIETILMDLGTKIENDDFVKDASFNKNAPLLIAISKGEAKREIVNGNLIYSIPNPSGEGEIKMDYSQLKDSLVSNDPEVNKNFNAVASSANTRGKEVGSVWDTERQGVVNEYERSLSTKKGFAANIFTKQEGLKHTFAEYMQGKGDGTLNMQIWDALKQAGYNVPEDQDGDGKITESDFANKENGIALINSLTDITDPNFDFQTAKLVAAEFYADNIAKKEFSDGNLVRDKDKKKPTDPNAKTDTKTDTELNPFSKGGGSRIVDATGKSIYIANTERNNRRRSVMNIVNDKPGAGTRFVGTLGDYEWDKDAGIWRSGENTYETIDLMKDERLHFSGGKFESGLGTSTVQDLAENKPMNMAGEIVEGGVYGNFFQKDDDDAMDNLKAMFPTSFTFEETGMFGWGKGIEIFHPTLGSLGKYMFRRDAGDEASDEAKRFNSNMAQYFKGASNTGGNPR